VTTNSILGSYFAMLNLASAWVTLADQLQIRAMGGFPIPPLHLRHRVHGSPDLPGFLQVGARSAQDIVNALAEAGYDIGRFRSVLDFGCGCARTLLWLERWLPCASIYGTDIDPELIEWDRRHLHNISFSLNQADPPLPFADKQFDFVYAVSVFTHLNEAHQLAWLDELARLTQAGGVVVVTVHGEELARAHAPDAADSVRESGIAFVPSTYWDGVFPEWYQNTYHSQEYVMKTFGRYFEILSYIPRGLNDGHDVVVMRRPEA
jgi:ubiquinone/menaquinone biosynthesis C-methylase UbiE